MSHVCNTFYNMFLFQFKENDEGELLIGDITEDQKRKYQYMAKDKEGRDVFLADSNYVLQMAQQDFKHIKFHFTSEF